MPKKVVGAAYTKIAVYKDVFLQKSWVSVNTSNFELSICFLSVGMLFIQQCQDNDFFPKNPGVS